MGKNSQWKNLKLDIPGWLPHHRSYITFVWVNTSRTTQLKLNTLLHYVDYIRCIFLLLFKIRTVVRVPMGL